MELEGIMSNNLLQGNKATKNSGFWTFIKSAPINTISLIPPLIACLIVVVWIVTKEKLFPAIPQIFNYLIMSIALLIVGSVGIIYIYRREIPGPVSSVTIKGRFAVVVGYVTLLFFWGLGIAGIVFALAR